MWLDNKYVFVKERVFYIKLKVTRIHFNIKKYTADKKPHFFFSLLPSILENRIINYYTISVH